ncbi:serine/threonine protein kinase [Streptomyces puniciscabiei]|uniref:Serine/threonine protein kinase n=2 Tax=Streptomyces puniciscabiei TaxID=164348 RepID=A0A542UAM4_9ACTN|nr:protein kinase [Streptomyces puniciscabiei]TQK96127.1 serine/threonine protein kinase [Streptomyces puniciscabiei]
MPTPLTHDDPVALGPFRLIARLGSGGMGTVYVARSAGGRTVALKTMHAAIATDPAARTRFRLEVDAARVIGDQFGARVMDADPLAETPWLATEYVLGPPLDEAVEGGGPLPEQSVRALGAALCSALGQLHRSDVVHRDLKPSNILLTAYGPKVIDFGIARAIGDERLTRAGAAVGTPAFMSPEQATGQDHDAAGDVFALAGVLVYAATGRGPFGHGQTADLLYRVRYAEADLSGVPAALVPVLAQCLAKEPGARPTTAQLAVQLHDGKGEFADHLPHELLADIGRRAADVWRLTPQRLPAPAAEAGPTTVTSVPKRGLSRRGFLAAGGGLAVTAAAGGGLWWYRGRAKPLAKKAPQQTRNLDPLWHYGGKGAMEMDSWGLIHPYRANGSIWLPYNAVMKRLNPSTGTFRDVLFGGNWWQAAAVNDRLYMLQQYYPENGKTPHGVMSIDIWDEGQNYEGPTSTRFASATSTIKPNQLLCITDGVAYVALGYGKDLEDQGFLPSQTWTLRAADFKSGKTLWTKPLPKRSSKSHRLHFLAAKVAGGRLVTFQEVTDNKPHIVARDIASGVVLWDKPYDIEDIDSLRSEIAADDTHLYVGGAQLRALRLSDGTQVWASKSGQRYSPPTLAKGVLYAVAEGVGLMAVDTQRGKVLWTEATAEADQAYMGWQPIIGTRYGYYKNGLQLRAVSLSAHNVALTYKTTAVEFHADTQSGLVLGVEPDDLSAYPLK